MIGFDNVTKYYKSNVGLEKVSVKINRKAYFVFLAGPASGAGKSTFVKLILKTR